MRFKFVFDNKENVKLLREEADKLDKQLADHRNWLGLQIRERCNFLAEEKRRKNNTQFTDWNEQIELPLTRLRQQMIDMNVYIYNHATQFDCFSTQAARLKAKKESEQAYQIIRNVIESPSYTIDAMNVDLLKIHDKAIRNAILLIVAGVMFLAMTAAICAGGPFVIAAISGGVALSTAVFVLSTLAWCVSMLMPMFGFAVCFAKAMEKFTKRSAGIYFHDLFSKSLTEFFRKDVNELLPAPESPVATKENATDCVVPVYG